MVTLAGCIKHSARIVRAGGYGPAGWIDCGLSDDGAMSIVRGQHFKGVRITWVVAHGIGIALWLVCTRSLWQISGEERCPDFGDSMHFMVVVVPSLAAGVLCAAVGLLYSWHTHEAQDRPTRVVWSACIELWSRNC